MTRIQLTIPDERLQEICDAVGEVYNVAADRNGLKEHFLQHLRETITELRRRQAALGAAAPFGREWGDLANDDIEVE